MTNMEALRKRALQRLTSPPEILYAFTRHWILITGLVTFATLILAAKVSTDMPMYEAKATLTVSNDQAVVVDQLKGGGLRDYDAQREFVSRVALFSNDTVLRKLVQTIKPVNVFAQDWNPEEQDYGRVRELVSRIKKKIIEILEYLEHPRIHDYGEEHEIQKAVSAFKRRSMVTPNQRTGTVLIQVFGTSPELLERELEQWIAAYISRLVELSKETRDYPLKVAMERWKAMEDSARKDLEAFRKENPEVSKTAQEFLVQGMVALQMRRLSLEKRIEEGDTEITESRDDEDPEILHLESQKREIEAQQLNLQSLYPLTSEKMRPLNESLRRINEMIESLRALNLNLPRPEKGTLREILKDVVAAIESTSKKQSELVPKLEDLRKLEEEYQLARTTRKSYEVMSHEALDLRESAKLAQVSEKPQVSWLPYDTYPYRQVLYGGAAGLAAGIVIALLLELLRGTVRFKSDIETEYPVRVIGVIPLR